MARDAGSVNCAASNRPGRCLKLFLNGFIGFETNLSRLAENCMSPKYATRPQGQHPTINLPTSRRAPTSKHQRTTAESHIQSREVWDLDLLWMLAPGCCLCLLCDLCG